MVQTYGVARDTAAEPSTSRSESSALLGGDRDTAVKRVQSPREGHASFTSCVSNLMNTIIGSGTFLIPCRVDLRSKCD